MIVLGCISRNWPASYRDRTKRRQRLRAVYGLRVRLGWCIVARLFGIGSYLCLGLVRGFCAKGRYRRVLSLVAALDYFRPKSS